MENENDDLTDQCAMQVDGPACLLPLACACSHQLQTPPAMMRPPKARDLMAPDATPLKSLDLKRAVRAQHGRDARLVKVGELIYDWRARLGGKDYNLDLRVAAIEQYGAGWFPVALGARAADWRALNLKAKAYSVLPVMIVPTDFTARPDAVELGLKRLSSVLVCTRDWYDIRAGVTFHLLKPVVVMSGRSAATWDDISGSTIQIQDALWKAAVQTVENSGLKPGSGYVGAVSIFTGESAAIWLGAMGTPTWAVAPQRATSVECPRTGPLNEAQGNATYAFGHELGHSFGLAHTCQTEPEPECYRSIMQSAYPPDAVLSPMEIATLKRSPFLRI